MTSAERKAEQDGYTFTGIYEREWKKDIVKEKAEEIRKLGFKARIVQSSGGYSVYACKRYESYKVKERFEKELSGIESRKQLAKTEYETKMKEIEDREQYLKDYIEKCNEILNNK